MSSLWVVPSVLDFVTKWVKRRVKALGLKVVNKNVSYPASTDLVDVLAMRMVHMFNNLNIVSAYEVQAKGNVTHDLHELFHEVGLIFEAIDCRAEPRKQILELLEGLDVRQTGISFQNGLASAESHCVCMNDGKKQVLTMVRPTGA
jgi:hypothetical protein